ncbi:MAG: DevR family CRISPR-associated autoregulator [Pyrinomonadaceae bacterium]|nr:DevR family CRISPR-associated autoregulator [Pyrinomonadaceae bacterium]
MSKNKLTHIAGTFLIQAEGAFLNGAGLDTGEDRNAVIPKTFLDYDKNGRGIRVPYVSAQAWRRWLRMTFQEENPNEPGTELKALDKSAKGTTNKIGTEMNPVEFAEDDIFGYMRAAKGQGKETEIPETLTEDEMLELAEREDENKETKTKPKTEKTKAVMRPSPFGSSILKSIRKAATISDDEGFVHLKEGSPLPYKTKFYNTQLQAIFGLNYSRLGVFRNDGDRIELDENFVKQYAADGTIRETETGIYEITDNKRRERATMILKALAVLRGGAKQAQFGTDVTPKAIVVAGLNCGNLIFNDLFEEKESQPVIKLDALKDIINDYRNRLTTHVFIGIRKGYLHPTNETDLQSFAQEKSDIVRLSSPIEAVNQLTAELEKVG